MRCVRFSVTQCMSQEAWKCIDCLGLDTVAYAALSGCSELEWRYAHCRRGSPKPPFSDALIADRLGDVLVAIGGGGSIRPLEYVTMRRIFSNNSLQQIAFITCMNCIYMEG